MVAGKPARVAVIFQPGVKPRPIWFEMNNRQYKIKETTYFWTDRVGDAPLQHFAVTTEGDGNLYELVFKTNDSSWTLHTPE